MDILKVTPEFMESLASDMDAEIGDVQRTIVAIGFTLDRMEAYWQGDASSQHKQKYKNVIPKGKQLVQSLKEATQDMRMIAGLYTKAEDVNLQTSVSLPDDIF